MAEKMVPDAAATMLDGSPLEPACPDCNAPLPVQGPTCLRCGRPIDRIPVPHPLEVGSAQPAHSHQVPVLAPEPPPRKKFATMWGAVTDMVHGEDPEAVTERRRFKWLIIAIVVIVATFLTLNALGVRPSL